MKKTHYLTYGLALLLAGCTTIDAHRAAPEAACGPDIIPVADDAVPESHMMAKSARGVSNSSNYFQTSDRMMAYTAGFTLSVKQRDAAMDELKKLAESMNGYLVNSRRGNMTIKVPVKRADEFLKSAGKYGKVSDFHISANDLTDTITDLTVRLDNLRKLRTRLTELLSAAKTVDEMLKVERELNRVTSEIESMTARLKNNQNQVDFVTFTVGVVEEHGAMPAGTPEAIDHFDFLSRFADWSGGLETDPLFGVKLPEAFVAIERSPEGMKSGFAAISSDDCIFRTWEESVANDSKLDFWQKMICRALSSKESFDHIKCEKFELKGVAAIKITAQATTVRGLQNYMAVVALVDRWGHDELQIVEFFGPEEAFAKHEKAVLEALKK